MDNCRSNGCRRALKIALASHNTPCHVKINCHDLDVLTEYIISCVESQYQGFCAIFKQVSMLAVLINQHHPYGQYAKTFNFLLLEAICNCNQENLRILCCSTLQRLYPEVFNNKDFYDAKNPTTCCRAMIAAKMEAIIEQVCNAIFCDICDPFSEVTYPCNVLDINDGQDCYHIEYDYRHGKIKYLINNEVSDELSVHEVAELFARDVRKPLNPITSYTMKKCDRDFLEGVLFYEVSMIRYYLIHTEYPRAGYRV